MNMDEGRRDLSSVYDRMYHGCEFGERKRAQEAKKVDSVFGLDEVSFMGMDVCCWFLLALCFAMGPKLFMNEIMIVKNMGNGFLLRFVEFHDRCV
jgi:hypothetical protein